MSERHARHAAPRAGSARPSTRKAAEEGHDLVLTARTEADLAELADELRKTHGVTVRVIVADLSREGEADRVWAEAGDVTRLVNNAGLAAHGPVDRPGAVGAGRRSRSR